MLLPIQPTNKSRRCDGENILISVRKPITQDPSIMRSFHGVLDAGTEAIAAAKAVNSVVASSSVYIHRVKCQ